MNELLNDPYLKYFGNDLRISIKRLDKLGVYDGGNKHFKLRYNLQKAQNSGSPTVLTFGGAYSNHIAATAFACLKAGINCIGIVRGEEPIALSKTLLEAKANGMKLHFVTRSDYRRRTEPEYIKSLLDEYGPAYVIPEGGTNEEGIKGCEEILTDEDKSFDHVFCACATGGTLAGIAKSSKGNQIINGIAILKNMDGINTLLDEQLEDDVRVKTKINFSYTFGGYAKQNSELQNFISEFTTRTGVPIEPVYTGKTLYGVYDMLRKGDIEKNSRILIIHTGGLQYLNQNSLISGT